MMTFKKLIWLTDWLFMPKRLYIGPSLGGLNPLYTPDLPPAPDYTGARSEERRVGKECRWGGWWSY